MGAIISARASTFHTEIRWLVGFHVGSSLTTIIKQEIPYGHVDCLKRREKARSAASVGKRGLSKSGRQS